LPPAAVEIGGLVQRSYKIILAAGLKAHSIALRCKIVSAADAITQDQGASAQ
jgi:hypothetical protein